MGLALESGFGVRGERERMGLVSERDRETERQRDRERERESDRERERDLGK